jgi:YVTN family beta-propeller protein
MKTFKSTSFLIALLAVILVVPSCKKPEKEEIVLPELAKQRVFVLNEGNFLSGNASFSIYDPLANSMQNDVFAQINGRPLGDVLQSMCIVGDKAYFVVNNSNKIEITNATSLVSSGVINDLSLPRYMVAVNDQKAYVSEYISYSSTEGRISILDLATNTISGSITVGALPEEMLLHNGKMYVCISNENKIAVINTSTDAVETTITVSDGPNGIVKDADGKLWVMCGGNTEYDGNWEPDPNTSTAGALVKIDPATGVVESTLPFSEVFGSPAKLNINGSKNTLYYAYDGAIYSHSITASTLSSTPLISRKFYGLGIEPKTENIYVGSYGFASNKHLVRYTSSGALIDSTEVGVGPNGFYFNY